MQKLVIFEGVHFNFNFYLRKKRSVLYSKVFGAFSKSCLGVVVENMTTWFEENVLKRCDVFIISILVWEVK